MLAMGRGWPASSKIGPIRRRVLIVDVLRQRTLKTSIRGTGGGLHSGQMVFMSMLPAGPDTGIIFRRVDLEKPVEIRAYATNVGATELASTLMNENVKVATVEHLLSAIAGLGI